MKIFCRTDIRCSSHLAELVSQAHLSSIGYIMLLHIFLINLLYFPNFLISELEKPVIPVA